MNKHRIFETDNFLKIFDKIKGKNKTIIENKLSLKIYPQLKIQPHFGNNIKKLKNFTPETWRYRICNFRLFYEINDNERIVYIIGISTRQNAY
ncbi:hypothetical protein ES705_41193 [subsurface metagenome]